MKDRASVLVGLLWCVALLSVVVIGSLHTTRLDLMVVKNHGDLIQAHYLALAGVEKAKALLYHDARERKRSALNHSGELYNSEKLFRDVALGRGDFRVFRQGRRDEGGGVIYGIADEESRLNINTATAEDLMKLDGMTVDVAASIMDWRDRDNSAQPNGAEADYYASLNPPYIPRNGPFETLRELLLVRGVTPALFHGEDANDNGLLDPEEDDGANSMPPDNHDGILDDGWSGLLTTESIDRNLNAAGQPRVNVQSADEKELSGVPGISAEIAKAIVFSRNQNKLQTLADLLDVTAPPPPGTPGAPGGPPGITPQPGRSGNTRSAPVRGGQGAQATSQGGGATPAAPNTPGTPGFPGGAGPKVISQDLLMDIADDITTADNEEATGLVNINTAPALALAALPGMDEQLGQAVVSYRKSAGFFPNVAALLKVDGMTRDIFKQVGPRVTARSETFRILCEGRIPSSGARKRIEVIVHLGSTQIETLAYREDL